MSPPNFVGATANIEEDTPLPDWNKVCIFAIFIKQHNNTEQFFFFAEKHRSKRTH